MILHTFGVQVGPERSFRSEGLPVVVEIDASACHVLPNKIMQAFAIKASLAKLESTQSPCG